MDRGCDAPQYSGSEGARTLNGYLRNGPHQTYDLNVINARLGGTDKAPLMVQLQVTAPLGMTNCPLVVLTAGFLLDAAMYRSYAQFLASWGYVVALYDVSEVGDDVSAVAALRCVVDLCLTKPQVVSYLDRSCVMLAGHSRGAKLSALAAAQDLRVKGLLLMDPVDSTQMTPAGPNYPSALWGLSTATGAPRYLPVLIVGASLGGDIIPAESNYRRFTLSCMGPLWEVDLQCGHLQFLDKQMALFSMFSSSGPVPDAVIRQVTQAAMLMFLELVAKPLALGKQLDPQGVQRSLQQQAQVLHNLAPLASTIRHLEILPGAGPGTQPGAYDSTTNYAGNVWRDAGTGGTSSYEGAGAAAGAARVQNAAAGTSSASSSASSSSSSSSSSTGRRSSSWSRSGGTAAWKRPETDSAAAAAGAADAGNGSRASQVGAAGSDKYAASSSPGASTRGRNGEAPAAVNLSYEQLMAMRAKELKQILLQQGIPCDDCFEKADLAKRIVERCTA